MNIRRLCLLTSITIAASSYLTVQESHACSPIPPSGPARTVGEVGPEPLLITFEDEPNLVDAAGNKVATLEVVPDSRLEGLEFDGSSFRYFKPVEPLSEGRYRYRGLYSESKLTVTGTASTIPSTGTSQGLTLHFGSGEDDVALQEMGCGGLAHVGCGGGSHGLTITLEGLGEQNANSRPSNYLLNFTTEDGTKISRFTAMNSYAPTLDIHYLPGVDSLAEQSLCIRMAGVSFAGEIGEEVDLGCIDPNDTEDERVQNSFATNQDQSEGCTTSSRPRSVPTMFLLAIMLGISRMRRRAL